MKVGVARLLYSFAKGNKKLSTLLVLNVLFWSFTFPLTDFLLGKIVDQIKYLHPPLVFSQVGWLILAYLVLNVLRNLNYYSHGYAFSILLPQIKAQTVFGLFRHLTGQSYNYFLRQRAGVLSNKLNNAINGLEPLIQAIFTTLLPPLLALFFSGLFLATVSIYFMIAFWCWAGLVASYAYFAGLKGQALSKEYANSNSGLSEKIVDCVANINNVLYNASQEIEQKELKTSLKKMALKDRRMQVYLNRARFIQSMLTSLYIAVVVAGLLYGFNQHKVSVGDFVFVLGLSFSMIGLVFKLGINIVSVFKFKGQLLDGLSLFADPFEVEDIDAAEPHIIKNPSIDVHNMHFSYQGPLFEGFNLHIKAGEKIGIVGHSGGGKSTLIKLLMRLYDIKGGEIRIDGVNINQFTLRSLRSQIALVPQELQLFHRSILDNIAYGSGKNAREAIITASKLAHAHDFIMRMPEQYDTIVGETGHTLSSGQQQRIGLARAILKNAPILLLDEATSALDSHTEDLIQQSLNELMKNKTTVVIAQRLSTLKLMDRILVIDKGAVIESGTHDELLEQNGLYGELWKKQTVKQASRRTRS